MLTDLYPKHADGYSHWQSFITKDYYEHYLPKEKTVYDLCLVRDQDAPKKNRMSRANSIELIQMMQDHQKVLSQNIIDEKVPAHEAIVADWLRSNTKHFGRMSMECVKEIAQLTFTIPESQGSGTFTQG